MAETIPYFVAPNDPSLVCENVQFPGSAGTVKGYFARPKDGTRLGAVVVIHENRGLVDHIKDIARRLAKEGFAALAVDFLSRQGGYRAIQNPRGSNSGDRQSEQRFRGRRRKQRGRLPEKARLCQWEGRR